MARFDHNAPYGEILGHDTKGAAFWQTPHTFDKDYNHVDPDTGKVLEYALDQKAPPLKIKTKGQKETPEMKKQRQQGQLNNPNTAAAAAAKNTTVGVVEAPLSGKIDLLAWAEGKGPKNTPWFSVKAQMADEGYDPVPQNAAEARAAIIAKN